MNSNVIHLAGTVGSGYFISNLLKKILSYVRDSRNI